MTASGDNSGDQPRRAADADFIGRAIARLEEQSELADELALLARGQASLIAEGNADELLVVLEKRQGLIDRLLDMVDEITPLAEAIQQSPQQTLGPKRDHVRELIDSIGARLVEVVEIDSSDRARLHDRLEEVHRDMNVNGAARTARRAYTRSNPGGDPLAGSTNRFTDRKG